MSNSTKQTPATPKTDTSAAFPPSAGQDPPKNEKKVLSPKSINSVKRTATTGHILNMPSSILPNALNVGSDQLPKTPTSNKKTATKAIKNSIEKKANRTRGMEANAVTNKSRAAEMASLFSLINRLPIAAVTSQRLQPQFKTHKETAILPKILGTSQETRGASENVDAEAEEPRTLQIQYEDSLLSTNEKQVGLQAEASKNDRQVVQLGRDDSKAKQVYMINTLDLKCANQSQDEHFGQSLLTLKQDATDRQHLAQQSSLFYTAQINQNRSSNARDRQHNPQTSTNLSTSRHFADQSNQQTQLEQGFSYETTSDDNEDETMRMSASISQQQNQPKLQQSNFANLKQFRQMNMATANQTHHAAQSTWKAMASQNLLTKEKFNETEKSAAAVDDDFQSSVQDQQVDHDRLNRFAEKFTALSSQLANHKPSSLLQPPSSYKQTSDKQQQEVGHQSQANSTIFTLKQINREKTRKQMLERLSGAIELCSKQRPHRQELILMNSAHFDFEKYVMSQAPKRTNCSVSRKQSNQHSQQFSPANSQKAKPSKTPQVGPRTRVTHGQSVHYILEPVRNLSELQPLGHVDEGSSVCQTLIGSSANLHKNSSSNTNQSGVYQKQMIAIQRQRLQSKIMLSTQPSRLFSDVKNSSQSSDSIDAVSFQNKKAAPNSEQVSYQLFSPRELDVLRAKIEKRIELQKEQTEKEENVKTLFEPELAETKTGPQRLKMEKVSRSQVISMLQDNKQKLRQTWREMKAEAKELKRQSNQTCKSCSPVPNKIAQFRQTQTQSNFKKISSPIHESSPNGKHKRVSQPADDFVRDRRNKRAATQSRNKMNKTMRSCDFDEVLRRTMHDRLHSGAHAFFSSTSVLSHLDQINDAASYEVYNLKQLQRQKRQAQKTSHCTSPLPRTHPHAFKCPHWQNSELPEYMTRRKLTQETRYREERNKQYVGKIDHTIAKALLEEKDEEQLHGQLKYQLPRNIKVQATYPDLHKLVHAEPRQAKLSSDELREREKMRYHAVASTFKSKGKLMTRKEMEELLAKLIQQQRCQQAAKQPLVVGSSNERAVRHVFNSYARQKLQNKEQIMNLTVLLRGEDNKTEQEENEQRLVKQIQSYAQNLFQESSLSESDMPDYDPYRETPEFELNHATSPTLKLNSQNLELRQQINAKHLQLQKLQSYQKAEYMQSFSRSSPFNIKLRDRVQSIVAESPTLLNRRVSIRKVTLAGLKKKAYQKRQTSMLRQFPLQNLTDDAAEEFNHSDVAKKLIELAKFYQVHKDSLSQAFVEKEASNHRLGFSIECINDVQIVLPVLNLIQPDGTLFLKEYCLGVGHSRGLRAACSLKSDLLSKVLVDNCSLPQEGLQELLAGLSQLTVVRSLVLRRTAVGSGSIPYLSSLAERIFPENLAVLKIEKCQIDSQTTLGLCQMLLERCYIRQLALVRVAFNSQSIQVFCQYLGKKPYVEDLDLSDNRLDPKEFRPLLSALSKLQSLRSLNIARNLLLANARGPQIGTFVKEEKIIYGRASQPIEFENQDALQPLSSERSAAQTMQSMQSPRSYGQVTATKDEIRSEPMMSQNQLVQTARKQEQQSVSRKEEQAQSPLKQLTQEFELANVKTSLIELKVDEKEVFECLREIVKSQALQHLNLSDTGLTEYIILMISKMVKASHCLLSLHLSGNPGLKDAVMQRFAGKLMATYETPLLKNSFKQLLQFYNNKLGLPADAVDPADKSKTMRESILNQVAERDSLNSESLFFHSEQHKLDPQALKEQFTFKQNLAEKEALLPIDDAKIDRDHKRHFIVTRILGHELDMPGASEWQVKNESAQECWFCDRKQFTIFFWSPEYGHYTMNQLDWLSKSDKEKILKTISQDRDTNNLRTTRRSTISRVLRTPKHTKKFDVEKLELAEIDSNEESEDISSEDSYADIPSGITSEMSRGKLQSSSSSFPSQQDARFNQASQSESSEKKFHLQNSLYHGPTILGGFNNWQPQPLIKIDQLARVLDKRPPPDFIEKLIFRKKCRPYVTSLKQMKMKERLAYAKLLDEYDKSYSKSDIWGPIIAQYIKKFYKKARIVGRENFEMLYPKQIYIAGAYVDMGKQNYIVSHNGHAYFHETSIAFRKEPVPIAIKGNKHAVVTDRQADVFKHWQRDTDDSLVKMVDVDISYTKLDKFIKSKEDREEVRQLLIGHYEYLKDLYLTLTINSGNFPYLPAQSFTRFMQDCKVTDKKLTHSRVDQLMTAVQPKRSTLDKQLPQQGPTDLNRAQFMETLIRVAHCKYKENAVNVYKLTLRDSIEKLIIERLKPNLTPAPWQSFRDDELWTREVNLVFHDNAEGLHQVFDLYKDQAMNRVSYENAVKLLTKDISIQLDKFDAIYCFGMSLSSCTDLFLSASHKLFHMTYEEFLEMIARASDLHFQETDQESLPLWQKIMLVLDELFQLVEGCRTVMPLWTEEIEEAESDPEEMQVGLQRIKMLNSKVFTQSDVITGQQLRSHGDDNDFFK